MKIKLLSIVIPLLFALVQPILSASEPIHGEVFLKEANRLYKLTGQWRFSGLDKPEFSDPDFDDSTWDMIMVPGTWNVLGIKGVRVGWYRLNFSLSNQFRVIEISIRIPTIMDAHEIYVNGVRIGGAGIIGEDGQIIKKSSEPDVFPIPANLIRRDRRNVIAVRVADDVGWGGIETPDFYIGRSGLLELDFKKFIIWHSAVFTILGFLGIYFILLYLTLQKDRVYLHFSLLALTISLMLFGYHSFTYWIFDNYWFYLLSINSGPVIAIVFGFHFIYSFYHYPPDKILRFITIFGALQWMLLMLTPIHHIFLQFHANIGLIIALMFDALGFIYLVFLIFKGLYLKKKGAKSIAFGCIIAMICFLNDILGYLLALNAQRLGSVGTVILMISISFAIFFRNSQIAFNVHSSKNAMVLDNRSQGE